MLCISEEGILITIVKMELNLRALYPIRGSRKLWRSYKAGFGGIGILMRLMSSSPLVRFLYVSSIFLTDQSHTSDETDPSFWSEVTSYGWRHLNHTAERTHERYGEWYPILLDIVAQSMAVGFVGTQGSTFSLISARRVEDWNSGESVMVSYYD